MTRRTVAIAGLLLAGTGGVVAVAQTAAPTLPGFVVYEIEVTDPPLYERYKALAPAAVAKAGGSYLVRGGKADGVTGPAPAGRVVITQFPSVAAATAFLRSADYAPAAAIRAKAAKSRVYVVEGMPQ